MKIKDDKNIFQWAWEQRQKGVDPDEPLYSMAETIAILTTYSDPKASEKKIRDYERDGVVSPYRTEGKHRTFSVSNILSIHLMMQGTKYLGGKKNTIPIVKLYELSRRQPKKKEPRVFDYDPTVPSVAKIHDLLHEPLLNNPIEQAVQVIRIIRKIDTLLHLNEFMRRYNFAFKCDESELIEVERKGKKEKIAPPVIEWESVKKAIAWNNFYYAEMKVKEERKPKTKEEWDEFDNNVNQKIYKWLKKGGYIVELSKKEKKS
ncbi:MAG: hypothetical protein H7A34_01830 [bacterium]|nr:hypothetical protein [bacterium]